MFVRLVLVVLAAALLWAVFARESGAGGPERVHVVRPGETIWSIVEDAYRGDPRKGVWEVQRRNHLDGAAIVPGQRLALP